MYMMTEAQKMIRIPPARLGEDIAAIVGSLASEQFEGKLQEDRSVSVLVLKDSMEPVGDGKIVHGDGAVYQKVKFKQLVFQLRDHEVVEGEIEDITGFGAFVRFGPLRGLLHVSQIMDDRFDIDAVNNKLIGKESRRSLAVGDRVRVRVVSIELNEKNVEDSHIGLTMRQPGLGRLDWIDEDEKKTGERPKAEKKGKKKGGEE